MMQYNNGNTDLEVKIQHIGLKKDVHQFMYKLDDKFFANYDNSIIQKGDISIKLQFDKRIEPYIINMEIDGNIISECDKCSASFPLRIQSDNTFYVKFSGNTTEEEQDTEVLFIGRDEPEINLSKIVYDILHLDLPIYKVCNEPGNGKFCDLDVLKALNDYLSHSDDKKEKIDPRWAKLKNIKDDLN